MMDKSQGDSRTTWVAAVRRGSCLIGEARRHASTGIASVCGGLVLIALSWGCRVERPVEAPEPPRFPLAAKLLVVTEDVSIRSQDGKIDQSFEDKPIRMKGTAGPCEGEWNTANWKSVLLENDDHYVKRVTVKVGQMKLFGILALCGIPPNSTGPAARAYRIQVPQEYVDATSEGRVSVVFEKLNTGGTSWVLWLSQEPFRRF
jgi:hypothetical protein